MFGKSFVKRLAVHRQGRAGCIGERRHTGHRARAIRGTPDTDSGETRRYSDAKSAPAPQQIPGP
ncbi:hypothetical protein BSLA_02f2451 [Burkholderia stabilis]|nr:hypothetical protein BSLA_02f2451 [Burkholderia stabilis]